MSAPARANCAATAREPRVHRNPSRSSIQVRRWTGVRIDASCRCRLRLRRARPEGGQGAVPRARRRRRLALPPRPRALLGSTPGRSRTPCPAPGRHRKAWRRGPGGASCRVPRPERPLQGAPLADTSNARCPGTDRSPSRWSHRRSASRTWTTDTSLNAMGLLRHRRQKPSRISTAGVGEPSGWPHGWQRGWSHVAGKTSTYLVPCRWQTTRPDRVVTLPAYNTLGSASPAGARAVAGWRGRCRVDARRRYLAVTRASSDAGR